MILHLFFTLLFWKSVPEFIRDYSQFAYAGPPEAVATHIRVRIAESIPAVEIRGFDLRIYETQKWGLKLVASADKISDWEFRCQDGKIRAHKKNSGSDGIFVDLLEPVSIQTPVGFVNFGKQPYREELRIFSVGLLCDVVNDVDLEKYLDGLVNSEFSSKWNEESIAAQVVAARTYAYYQILEARNRKGAHFDVDATVKDQVYNGSMKEDFHSSRIAAKTRGLVLTSGQDQNPYPLKSFYHSTCGGLTELPQNVWGSSFPGFLKSVKCTYCNSSPRYRWSFELGSPEIARLIYEGAKSVERAVDSGSTLESKKGELLPKWPKNALSVLQQNRLIDLRVTQVNPQKRVTEIVTTWADGKTAVDLPISGPRFRDWMGVGRLRSTAFQVFQHQADGVKSWHFEGNGNGHGVGMCQWGAKIMGDQGHKMSEILSYYYPDAILRKLW